ncbi:DUF2474 domain-containing protein [Vibrio sp. SM6]|uniref:DUF2474 domain-containing protein n=1 Tax=Vibrio agarilyticus TaxID=2726741 RepID=A0A7X8TNX5_9VIBR|nr:DUF2474 domain-containing protein [Vibrio agarilyticus]NLS12094.1 DUF2474 domain-containing protein [Vibrio agarilyticus]
MEKSNLTTHRWQRWLWLLIIWSASVATLAIIAYLLRLIMRIGVY